MSFLKNLSDTVMDAATTISAKSIDLMETGKYKIQRAQLEMSIKEKKVAIGDLIYQAHKQNQEENKEILAILFQETKDLESQVAALDEKISRESAQSGQASTSAEPAFETAPPQPKLCSQCGVEVTPEAKFCSQCGHPQ